MATVVFYSFDPETLEEEIVGTVNVNGDDIVTDDDLLRDIVMTKGLEELEDWSNGYLYSKVNLVSSGYLRLHLIGQHDQGTHGTGGGGSGGGVGRVTESQLKDLEGKVVRFKELGGGRSAAKVEMGFTKEGGSIIRKTNLTKDEADMEYLSAKLGQAVGAPVPNITRIDRGTGERKYGYVAERAPGSSEGSWGRGPVRRAIQSIDKNTPAQAVKAEGAKEIGILDYLNNNVDRRAANWMIDKTGGKSRVYGIDHSAAFWPQPKRLQNQILTPFTKEHVIGKKFPKSEVAKIRKNVQGTRKEFVKAGRTDWYDKVIERVDSLETGAKLERI